MGVIANAADGSFSGVSFWEQWPNAEAPEPSTTSKDAVLEIPGSSNVYYQDFGQAAQTLDLEVAVESPAAIKAKRGVRGSLVYHAGTVTARLRSVTNIRKDAIIGGYKVTLSFLIG